jgi:hypothetical protein
MEGMVKQKERRRMTLEEVMAQLPTTTTISFSKKELKQIAVEVGITETAIEEKMLDIHWSMNEHLKKREALGKFLLQRACLKNLGELPKDAEVRVLVNGHEVPFAEVIDSLRDDVEELANVKAMQLIEQHQEKIEDFFRKALQNAFKRALKEIGLNKEDVW